MKSPKDSIENKVERLVNLTGWRIILERRSSDPSESPEVILDIPPSTKEASFASNISESILSLDETLEIPIFDVSGSAIVGLPTQVVENRYYIVTPVILEALRGNREDCLAPFTYYPYGELEKTGEVFTVRTIGFLRGSFSQDR
jgi:hypothetical protein